jgi:cell division protein FtsB
MMNKNYISYIFNIILVGIITYLLFFNNKPTVDIKEYTDKIDSLSIVIETNNKKLDSLSNLENQQETNIKNLKEQLNVVSNKNKNLKKKYEQEIARYDSMSDNDITNLFTETFK